MGKKSKNDLDQIMNDAVEAASEMSALLREAESSRKDAEQLIKQLKAGKSSKVKNYLAGKRPLNEDEQARMKKIKKVFEEEVGDLGHSREVVEEVNRDLEKLNIEDLTHKGKRRIVI